MLVGMLNLLKSLTFPRAAWSIPQRMEPSAVMTGKRNRGKTVDGNVFVHPSKGFFTPVDSVEDLTIKKA